MLISFSKVAIMSAVLSLFGMLSSASYAAAPPAKAFGELPVSLDADLSPDGKRIGVISNQGGKYFVYTSVIDDLGSKPTVLALGEDIRPEYIRWVNNDRFVVSVVKLESYRDTPFMIGYLYTQDVSGDEKGRLVVKPRNMFRQFNNRVVDWLEDDPDHILMAYSEEEFSAYPDVYKVKVENGRDRRVKSGVNGIERWMTDDNGVLRIGVGETDKGKDRMRIFDPLTEKWESDFEYPGLEADTPIFGILSDGRELIVGRYNGRDTLGLYIYDLVEKKVTRELFHNDYYDASGVVVSTDGETVIGAKYIADEVETELLGEYSTLIDELRAKYPDYSVRFVDQTDDYRTLIVRMSTAYEPGGLFMYSSGDENVRLVGRQYNGLEAADMGSVVAASYTARDGQKIPAYITMPVTVTTQAQFKNLPFIILPHGGPYGRDAKRFDYFAQFFASRGYGVMQMNFRGSDGYGKSFEEAGRNNWIVMQEDVEDATKYLFKKGYADPERTCIAGWSYGGYAALMGAAKDIENRYSCVIAMAALTDIADAKRDLAKYRGGKNAAKTFFGAAMDDKETRKANSPTQRADDIKVPVFLAHGDSDINVHFDQYKKMKRALEKAGVDGTYMEFEDEDHYLSRQENREAFFEGLDKFLIKVNGESEFMAK